MFSGIVETVGKILSIDKGADGACLSLRADKDFLADIKVGDSVAVSGVCLTATSVSDTCFQVDAMHETLRRSKLGNLTVGDSVNLERALRLQDRLGGHLVSGHVDCKARVDSIKDEGFSKVVTFEIDSKYAAYFIEKGSVCIDGCSLTVSAVDSNVKAKVEGKFLFSVCLIPHTLEVTTLGSIVSGDAMNIEVDMIAKYVARLLEAQGVPQIEYA